MGTILTAVFAPIVVSFVLTKIQHAGAEVDRNGAKADFTLRLPNIVFWIGFLDALLAAALLLYGFFTVENGLPVLFLLIPIIWLGAYLMIQTRMFRIVVKGEHITVLYPLRKPYRFTFQAIDSVSRKMKSTVNRSEYLTIRTAAGKKLTVSSTYTAYRKLVQRIGENVDHGRLSGFETAQQGFEEGREGADSDFAVYPSKKAFVCAILAVAVGITGLSLELHMGQNMLRLVLFGLCLLYGICQTIKARTFRVIVKEALITVRLPWKKPYSFSFREINSAKCSTRSAISRFEEMTVWTTTGRKLKMDCLETGYFAFRKRIVENASRTRLSGF